MANQDEPPWSAHIRAWSAEGFSVEPILSKFDNHLSSDDLLSIESALERARSIVKKMQNLPASFQDAVGDLTMRIYEDPYDADEVQNEYSAMLLARAPWIPAAERSRARWSAEGRTIELEAWLRRLTEADTSSRTETDGIITAIEEVRPRAEVRRSIEALEGRQREREGVLNDLLTILKKSGWLVDSTSRGNLAQRFDAAGELQRMDTKAREVLKIIERDIEPWRPKSAASLLEQLTMIKSAPDHDLLARIGVVTESEVAAITAHRTVVDREIHEWLDSGVILPQEKDAKANFREHELNSERLRADVSAAAEASERILQHQADSDRELQFEGTLWHAEDAGLLVAAAARFDRDVELIEMAMTEKFDEWKKYGIEIEELLERLHSQPRWVKIQVERIDQKIGMVIQLLIRLSKIDSSVIDDDRLEKWTRSLRGLPDDEQLESINTSLDRLTTRQRRHRESLDDARHKLHGGWPSELDPTMMTLYEYEEAILTLESGKRFNIQGSSSNEFGQYEIERWAAEGWDVSGLRQKSAEDPAGLAKELPLYREAIRARPNLIRLLLPLPWGRDPKLTSEVEASLRRPDALSDLESRRRNIATHLASLRPSAERPLFVFQPTAKDEGGLEIIQIDEGESDSVGPVFTGSSADDYKDEIVMAEVENNSADNSIIDESSQDEEFEIPNEFTEIQTRISVIESDIPISAVLADSKTETTNNNDERKANLAPREGVDDSERRGGLEPEFMNEIGHIQQRLAADVQADENKTDDNSEQKEGTGGADSSKTEITSFVEENNTEDIENTEKEQPKLEKITTSTQSIADINHAVPKVTSREDLIDWVSESDGNSKNIGVEQLLNRLGITNTNLDQLVEIAAAEHRDIRVQRLLRLITLVNSIEDEELRVNLLGSLVIGARVLDDWTALRLVNRRAKSGDGLLADSARLIERLSDVPGPGVPLPAGVDDTPLPKRGGNGLIEAVAAWRAAVDLPHAGALGASSP